MRGKQHWKVVCKCSHMSETLLYSSLPYTQKSYSECIPKKVIPRVITGRTPSQFQISSQMEMDEIERRRGIVRERYALLRADHPALPSVLRDFQVKEHVCLVVNTSFNQGWYNLGSNWPIRSAAPDGCCSDRIRKIAAYAGCGSPLAPWWASCWQICLFMMPF